MGVAFFVSCLKFYDITKFSPAQTISHFSGKEESFNVETDYEFNEADMEEDYFYPMSFREVIEILHVHAFMIPLIIFVMSRILSMTDTGENVKITLYIASFIGIIMNLSGPYLIGFKSEICVISLITSYVILGSCFITFISLPVYSMWFKRSDESDYWL